MSVVRLHHANISIPPGEVAENQARAFYCDVLGLPEIEKPDALKSRGGFWVQLANCDVHIGVQPDVDRAALRMHLAYEVDDLAAWRTKLESQGIVIKDNIAIPDFARFEIRDPFGNRIEFVQPRA